MRESFQAILMTKSFPVVSVAYTVSEYLYWYMMSTLWGEEGVISSCL